MRLNPRALPRLLRALRRDTRGLAMIEMALVTPPLIVLSLYGVETAHLALATMKVNQIAMAMSDNAARVRDSISEADVNELLMGARIIGGGIDFTKNGRVVLSSVEPNGLTGSSAGQYIRWQRCIGALNTTDSAPAYGIEGAGKTDGSVKYMGPSTRQIAATANSALIYVEVTYQYQPVFSDKLFGPRTLRSESAFSVRERASEALQAASGNTPSRCTTFSE